MLIMNDFTSFLLSCFFAHFEDLKYMRKKQISKKTIKSIKMIPFTQLCIL